MRDELPNPYSQVLYTYLRRATSSWVVIVLVFPGLLNIATGTVVQRSAAQNPFLSLALALEFLALLMWMHFGEQILHPRRYLIPGYLAPHVAVFSLFALMLVVVFPGLIIVRGGFDSVGLLAITIGFFALLGWAASTARIWPIIIAYVLLNWPVFQDSAWQHVRPFISGEHERLAVALLICAVVLAIIPVIRLCRLTEEHRAYRSQPSFDRWSVRARMTGETNQAWQAQRSPRLLRWPWHDATFGPMPAGASLWTRARRWSSLGGGANSLMVITVMDCAVLVPILILSKGLSITGTSPLLIGFLMVMILPPGLISQEWMQKWRFLEADSLRPISRENFLKEIAMAIAQRYLQAWYISAALILITVEFILTVPHPLRMWVYFVLVSFGIGVFGWGISVWLLRYRSPGILMLLGLPLVPFAATATAAIVYEKTSYANAALAGIAALAAAGLWIARHAYRRWLITELG